MAKKEAIAVNVEVSVLKWLIESSGWSREEIAKRLKTSLETVHKIESGEKKPTLRQLQELSTIFKRPLAAFLLTKPLTEKPKPKDFRMLPEKVGQFDKKTILVMRRSRRLQELSKELSSNIAYETKTAIPKISVSKNSAETAKYYRERFALTVEKQRKFKSAYEFFSYLREAFEDLNIFVFQFSMPVEDARGFVLIDQVPSVIVVNTKDSIEARLFTLMHEFAHILLGESVIDLPDAANESKDATEKWCNQFSSAFLLPSELGKSIFEANKQTLTETQTLNALSKKYKVSKAMLLRNMLNLNYLQSNEYHAILNRFSKQTAGAQKQSQGGGIPVEVRCLSEVGNKFVSLVARNYDNKSITYSDALNYLSIKSRKFDNVLAKAKK